MTSIAVEGACAFAWRNYLLRHSCVSEEDDRRAALCRYTTSLCDAGEYDFSFLQIAAVTYLKKLDELHNDLDARRAADQALSKRLGSRGAKAYTQSTIRKRRRSEPHARQYDQRKPFHA